MFKLFKRKLKTINKDVLSKKIAEFNRCGVSSDSEIIISLTSFPQRMYELHYTIYSLLNQSVKPSKVILWLGKEQFPNLEDDIPKQVLDLRNNGLTISWYSNIYSYTKLIPTLIQHPDNIIVTADDDIYYETDWLERLLKGHKEHPDCIISHRAHRVKLEKNRIAPYKKWKKRIGPSKPSFLNFLTGVGGVLYPPKCFYKDITNEELFTKLAPKADDVWFWAMAVLNNTKTFIPKRNINTLTYVNPERERGITNEITLFSTNRVGGNDKQISQVLEHYPQLIEKLFNS